MSRIADIRLVHAFRLKENLEENTENGSRLSLSRDDTWGARVCSRIKYPTPGDQIVVKTEVNAPPLPHVVPGGGVGVHIDKCITTSASSVK